MSQRDARPITIDLLRAMPLPGYAADAHKANRGKLLVIAGSRWFPGAAMLAAKAALRAGCGTARVAAPERIAVAVGVAVPDLMVLPLLETPSSTVAPATLAILEAQPECPGPGPGVETAGPSRPAAARAFTPHLPSS